MIKLLIFHSNFTKYVVSSILTICYLQRRRAEIRNQPAFVSYQQPFAFSSAFSKKMKGDSLFYHIPTNLLAYKPWKWCFCSFVNIGILIFGFLGLVFSPLVLTDLWSINEEPSVKCLVSHLTMVPVTSSPLHNLNVYEWQCEAVTLFKSLA